MSRSQATLEAEATAIMGMLERFLKHLPAAYRRMHEAQPGYPTGGTGGSGERATQPERTSIAGRDGNCVPITSDPSLASLAKMDRSLSTAYRQMLDASGLAEEWATTRVGSKKIADPTTDLWCKSCLRIQHCEPRRRSGETDCDWCYSTLRVLNEGRIALNLPALDELPVTAVRTHAEGRRVYQTDLMKWAGMGQVQRSHARKSRRKKR